jgi:hypothetical protein
MCSIPEKTRAGKGVINVINIRATNEKTEDTVYFLRIKYVTKINSVPESILKMRGVASFAPNK